MQWRPVVNVAGELGIHVRTLLREIHAGRLRAFRIGKGYRIAPDDLALWLEGRATCPRLSVARPRRHAAPPVDERDIHKRAERFFEEHERTRHPTNDV